MVAVDICLLGGTCVLVALFMKQLERHILMGMKNNDKGIGMSGCKCIR